jgi:hypothetical protein
MPTYQPLKLDPIINLGPNLPTDIDIDDLVAFFRLFFTDEVLQYIVESTNRHVESVRERGDSEMENIRPWRPINQIDIEIYLSTSSPSSPSSSLIIKNLGSLIWMDCHLLRVLEFYWDTRGRALDSKIISTAIGIV